MITLATAATAAMNVRLVATAGFRQQPQPAQQDRRDEGRRKQAPGQTPAPPSLVMTAIQP